MNSFSCYAPTFEEKCRTTDDGLVYNAGNKEGLYIIDLPDTAEVTIPEYIDGRKVVQLGYKDIGLGYMNEYWVDGSHVRQLTEQHNFKLAYSSKFTNLEKIVYIDFPYCISDLDNESHTIKVGNIFGSAALSAIELKKSDRIIDTVSFRFKTILIPDNVTTIETGVFDGLEGVTLKTPYESKPDGWAEGWNGTCDVEWGANINN